MFEYQALRQMWLRVPIYTEYTYGRNASEIVLRDGIVNAAEIESIQHRDAVSVEGKYTVRNALRMRSGDEILVAVSIEDIWRMLLQ